MLCNQLALMVYLIRIPPFKSHHLTNGLGFWIGAPKLEGACSPSVSECHQERKYFLPRHLVNWEDLSLSNRDLILIFKNIHTTKSLGICLHILYVSNRKDGFI